MTTAQDIITDSLNILGVYAAGETISDADLEQAFTRLNDMLDSWSNESLTCFAILEQSVALTAFQQSYTIGAGGNINATRPIRINDEPGSAYIQDSNGNNYPVAVVSRPTWNLIGNRSESVTANVPDTLWYDPQYPLGVLNFYPLPNIAGYTAFWDSYLQLTDFSTLTTAVSLPPGYILALKTNLAVHLKPYFAAAQLDPDVREQARESKGNVKRANNRPIEATFDRELIAKGAGTYNIYLDRSGS